MSNKKIKANNIINLHKAEFPLKQIVVVTNGGKEFEVQIQPKINETKIMELVADLTDRSNYCTKNNIPFNSIMHIYFLLLKHFTDIDFGNYKSIKKQYEQELKVVEVLVDLGIFNQIIDNFDENTMDILNESLTTYSKQTNMIVNNMIKQQIEEELGTEVIIDGEEL